MRIGHFQVFQAVPSVDDMNALNEKVMSGFTRSAVYLGSSAG
jgi:hypothetical protein